jgi:hypothetical protein
MRLGHGFSLTSLLSDIAKVALSTAEFISMMYCPQSLNRMSPLTRHVAGSA